MRRREFLGALSAGAAYGAMNAFAAEPAVEGTVTGEGKPLADVVVSDGLACTLTDRKGRFRLPRRERARFLFVTVPSGWKAEKEAFFLPAKSERFAFNLVRRPGAAKKGCRFLHMSDSEIAGVNPNVTEFLENTKRLAAKTKADFIVHTGDLICRAGVVTHKELMNEAKMGCPVAYCVGNHDLIKWGDCGEAFFEAHYGPCWYSFDVGGVHFVVTPMPQGDEKPSFTHNDVADWLRNDLAYVPKDRPVVFFNHYVPYPWSPKDCGRAFGFESAKLDLASACNFTGFVYGHTHHSYFRRHGKLTMLATANPNQGGIGHDAAVIREVIVAPDGRLTAKSHYQPVDEWMCESAGATWERDLGAPVYFGSPVAVGGRLFLATLDEGGLGTAAVFALSLKTGKVIWKTPMENSVKNSVVFHKNLVLAQDVEGRVRAFSAKDGSLVWKFDVPYLEPFPVESGLAVDEEKGVVIAGGGRRLTGLDALTGKVLWQGGNWDHDGEGNCTRPAAAHGVVVSPSQWKGIRCNDVATGRQLWYLKNGQTFFNGAEPRIDGDRVLVLVRHDLLELDLMTGKVLRETDFGDKLKVEVPTGILQADGKLVFGSWDGLVAVDAKTREIAWRIPVGPALVLNAPYGKTPQRTVATVPVALDGGRGAFTASDGVLRVFSLADGKVIREIKTGSPYFAGPAAVGSWVFAADLAGKVRAWSV